MNKAQFIEALAGRLGSDKKSAGLYLDAVLDEIYANVIKGDKVALTGFGAFEKRDRAARLARNPATGASVRVKKTSVPAFRAGAEFKAIVSGAKKLPKVAAKKAPAKAVTKAPTARAAKAPVAKVAVKTSPAKAAVKTAPAKTAVKTTPAKAPVKRATKVVAATKAPAKTTPAKAPVKRATKVVAATKAPAKRTPVKRAAR